MLATLTFGTVFGFLLARVGATRYEVIARMFLFEDPHLAIVMGVAIATAATGIALMSTFGVRTACGDPLPYAEPASPSPTLVPGSLLFGVGWGLTGACPGTALAQLGEGHLAGAFTVLGLFLGSALYAWRSEQK